MFSCSVMSDSVTDGLQPARLLCPWGFSRQEYYTGLPCPPPGDLPNPGTELRFPPLQADSLPSESASFLFAGNVASYSQHLLAKPLNS